MGSDRKRERSLNSLPNKKRDSKKNVKEKGQSMKNLRF